MRILILGGSGMLGHKLWERLPLRFPDTWMTLRGRPSDYTQFMRLQSDQTVYDVDVSQTQTLEKTLNEVKPDVIVNAVAVTKRHEGSRADPGNIAQVIRINSELPHRIASWAQPRAARVIQFSTDCVFDGKKGAYTDSDRPNAVDLYGRSKLLGEVGAEEGRCLTIRSSLIGHELFNKTELLDWFLGQRGKKIRGFRNAVFSGLATWVMADLVADLIEKFSDLNGVFQIASEPIDKYSLLCLARDIFRIDVGIEPDDSFVCKRNLDGSRFRNATGWVAPSWAEMMKGIADGY